jgi:hypothetical protein
MDHSRKPHQERRNTYRSAQFASARIAA